MAARFCCCCHVDYDLISDYDVVDDEEGGGKCSNEWKLALELQSRFQVKSVAIPYFLLLDLDADCCDESSNFSR